MKLIVNVKSGADLIDALKPGPPSQAVGWRVLRSYKTRRWGRFIGDEGMSAPDTLVFVSIAGTAAIGATGLF